MLRLSVKLVTAMSRMTLYQVITQKQTSMGLSPQAMLTVRTGDGVLLTTKRIIMDM